MCWPVSVQPDVEPEAVAPSRRSYIPSYLWSVWFRLTDDVKQLAVIVRSS